ncbi:hypothetical protein KI688_006603 [Linnemannia hyalina]|uniref:Uncharacterized protein n=1 Tax=Linnemannia hyalina TaxID=64524 RepID=A0A9P7XJL3_9FUNG|nr:hypothetical protein KI688_006603 [Linnemannia hyalina]
MSKSSHSSPAESSTSPSRPPLAPINIGDIENRRNGRASTEATRTTTPPAAASPTVRAAAAPYNAQQRLTRRTLRVDLERHAKPTQWTMPTDESEIRNTALNNLQSVYLRLQSERTAVLAQRASYLCDAFGAFDIPLGQDLEDIDNFNLMHDRVYTSLLEHALRLDKHIASVQELIQQFEFAVKRGHLFDDYGYLRTNNYTHGPLVGLMTNQVAREKSFISQFAPPSPRTVRRNLELMSPSDMTEEQLAYISSGL